MVKRILEALGVRPMINAAATQTPIGGSRMNPNVAKAMGEISQYFVDLHALHAAVGREIARMTHNEAAMVSGGVASAFYLTTMALVKQKDPAAFAALPQSMPRKHSILLYATQCVEYTLGIELAGVRLRRIQTPGIVDEQAELLEREIRQEKPLAVFYVLAGPWIKPGAPSLERTISVCRQYGVPVIVDAAAQLPPKSNLWKFTQMGAELALFSGGKDLCGPSNMGLVLGRQELVDICRSLISPNEGVGRFFKVGKEELIAAWVAVKDYMEADEAQRLAWCEDEVNRMVSALADIPALRVSRAYPNEAGQPVPRVFVSVLGANAARVERICGDFRRGEIPIAFLPDGEKGGFYINPMTLAPGESKTVIKAIRAYFEEG